MPNLTETAKIVIKKGKEVTLEEGYSLVIIQNGKYHFYPEGQLPPKKNFRILRKIKHQEVFGVSVDDNFELKSKRSIRHSDYIHQFYAYLSIVYGVDDPLTIVRAFHIDPVKQFREGAWNIIASFLSAANWEEICNPNKFKKLKANALRTAATTSENDGIFLFNKIADHGKEYGIKLHNIDFDISLGEEYAIWEIPKRKNYIDYALKENSQPIEDIERTMKALKESFESIKLRHETLEKDINELEIRYGNQGNISYELPSIMEFYENHEVIIRIANSDFNVNMLRIFSDSPLEKIDISSRMIVELVEMTNENVFQIKQMSTTAQAILDKKFTEWLFVVKPIKKGKATLVIKVSMVDGNGQIVKDVKNIKKEVAVISDNESTAKQLELLLCNNKVSLVIEQLMVLYSDFEDILNEIVILSRQQSELEHLIRCSLIKYDESLVAKNKICYALLNIIRKLK